jgi:hypothetical protein
MKFQMNMSPPPSGVKSKPIKYDLSYFSLGGQFYEQTDGITMGTPLSPVTADLLMEVYKDVVLEWAAQEPLCCFC